MDNININLLYIIESQYFPSIDWFKLSAKNSYVKIEQYDTFQKMTYRNRCIIAGSNGPVNLTVPLQNGREQKTFMKEVRIDNSQAWQKQHCKSLQSSYSNSPFFEYYAEGIFRELNRQYTFLFDLNWQLIQWLSSVLKLKTTFSFTSQFVKRYDQNEAVDMRDAFLPKNRLSVPPTKETYQQVFDNKFGFAPGLSVLDTLFCKGSL